MLKRQVIWKLGDITLNSVIMVVVKMLQQATSHGSGLSQSSQVWIRSIWICEEKSKKYTKLRRQIAISPFTEN
jgi:hypothetical protein